MQDQPPAPSAEEIPGASPPSAATRPHLRLTLVCLLFILSGGCGLAYEIIWSRFLGLMLGNTLLVHSVVLGAFMGGMAISSLALRGVVARLNRPLWVYGAVELGVSIYALLFPQLAEWTQQLVIFTAGTYPPGEQELLAVRLLLAVLLVFPPSLLMGATFPLLTSHLDRVAGAGAGGANWLYAANSAGAVLGCLITGFLLIRELGNTGSLLAVAILNIGVAAVALLAGTPSPGPEPEHEMREETTPEQASGLRFAILLAIGASGATAFIYEVTWTRLFAVTLGSSTYSFTLMLAAFITGLALGSLLAALPALKRRPFFWFALAELLIGVIIALSTSYYARLPYWYWKWKWLLRPAVESIWLYHLFQYGLTFLVMLLPTLLFGITFPLAIRAAAGGGGSPSRHAASVYGWNGAGTILGVTLASALLIPQLGLRTTLLVTAAANASIAALIWLVHPPARGPRWAWPAAGLIVPVLAAISAPWIPGSLTHGTFRSGARPPRNWDLYARALEGRVPVFRHYGGGSTVAVVRTVNEDDGKPQLTLVVDGKADASSDGDMPTQVLLAQLPLLLHPQPLDVFVLGLGSGVTAGSVLTHPVDRLDCAEISPGVVEATKHFGDVNGRFQQDPRFHLTMDDGKLVLAAGRRKYDVIISEPTNPWISGIGNLFSREAFHRMALSLKPGGVAAQWIHSYDLSDELVATIIRTYREFFPNLLIFQGASGDYILIGSRTPFQVRWPEMERRFAAPAVRRDLERISMDHLAAVLGQQTHGPQSAAALEQDGGINTDDYPLLEFLAPLSMYTNQRAARLPGTDQRRLPQGELLLPHYLATLKDPRPAAHSMLRAQADPRFGDPALRLRLLRSITRRWPADAVARVQLAQLLAANSRPEGALQQVTNLGGPQAESAAASARMMLSAEFGSIYETALPAVPVKGRAVSPSAPSGQSAPDG